MFGSITLEGPEWVTMLRDLKVQIQHDAVQRLASRWVDLSWFTLPPEKRNQEELTKVTNELLFEALSQFRENGPRYTEDG